MAELIDGITSIKDFFFAQSNYKKITNFTNKEVKYYLFSFEGKFSLSEILKYVLSNMQWCDTNYKIIEDNNEATLFLIKLKNLNEEELSSGMVLYFNKIAKSIILFTDEDREHFVLIDNFVNSLSSYVNKKFIKSQDIVGIINDFNKEGYYITSSMISSKKWWEKV